MITLTDTIPEVDTVNAELVKIRCTFDCYSHDSLAQFWVQDGSRAVISLLDGNMVIFNNGADMDELTEFVSVISPSGLFSDAKTVAALGLEATRPTIVTVRQADNEEIQSGDELSSRELYDILNVKELDLPEYEYFAVDYCRRHNRGGAQYFGIRDKCAAISFNSGNYAVMNGIASREKGFGGKALSGILSKNAGRTFIVCCRSEVMGFYEKYGFEQKYKTAYWERK